MGARIHGCMDEGKDEAMSMRSWLGMRGRTEMRGKNRDEGKDRTVWDRKREGRDEEYVARVTCGQGGTRRHLGGIWGGGTGLPIKAVAQGSGRARD